MRPSTSFFFFGGGGVFNNISRYVTSIFLFQSFIYQPSTTSCAPDQISREKQRDNFGANQVLARSPYDENIDDSYNSRMVGIVINMTYEWFSNNSND